MPTEYDYDWEAEIEWNSPYQVGRTYRLQKSVLATPWPAIWPEPGVDMFAKSHVEIPTDISILIIDETFEGYDRHPVVHFITWGRRYNMRADRIWKNEAIDITESI